MLADEISRRAEAERPPIGHANGHETTVRHHDRFGAAPGNQRPSCAFSLGAGDGNRTRTISLGICAIRAAVRLDLRCRVSASDRDRPLVTGVNGPLMARRTVVRPTLVAASWSSPVLLDSCRTRAVAVVSRLAQRPHVAWP